MGDGIYRAALWDLAEEERESGARWFGPEAYVMFLIEGPQCLEDQPKDTHSYVRRRRELSSNHIG